MSPLKDAFVLKLVKDAGVFRPRDLAPYGINRWHLSRLCEEGKLLCQGRGLYILANRCIPINHSLALAAKRVPHGVICLQSALRFHGVTTHEPTKIWMAVDHKARAPVVSGMSLHIVRFSGVALQSGIEEHVVEGVPAQVYSVAKTVADCFKYRNKIGIDLAEDALRVSVHARKCTMDELWYFAKICRVHNVMRPYMMAHASADPREQALHFKLANLHVDCKA